MVLISNDSESWSICGMETGIQSTRQLETCIYIKANDAPSLENSPTYPIWILEKSTKRRESTQQL